jgi:hypothetical protein
MERHVDALLLHRWQTPFVMVLCEENRARTVGIVATITLGPIGLLPVLHDIDTLTLGTLHVHKHLPPSPSFLRNCGVCSPMISEDQLN